jgi:hypothetical protein
MANDESLAKPTGWYFDAPVEPQETLRDKLAIGAFTGVMQELLSLEVYSTTDDELAKRCYAIADAFMRVRDKE